MVHAAGVDLVVQVTQTCTPLTLAAEICMWPVLGLFNGSNELRYLQQAHSSILA